ncbi:MAG: hypothetical protein AB3N33_06490 [Puniceicoccaceae bacterium]
MISLKSALIQLTVHVAAVIALHATVPPGTGQFDFINPANGDTLTVFYVKAASYNPADPPVLVLHGMKRNADEYRDAWIELAEEHGFFVVVPLFREEAFPGTVGYNLGNVFISETDLTKTPEKTWSYIVPDKLFDYLREESGDTTAAGYMAFGHSAGSQFLHRKVAFVPDDRLLLSVAANAGWYTFPNQKEPWPYGFAGTGIRECELPPFLASNMVLLLGDQDIDPNHESLRKTPEAMRQGLHRYERGHNFHAAGKALADKLGVDFKWRIETVPGVAHDNTGMAPAAARYMAEEMKREN